MVRQIALAYWRTACRFRRKAVLDCDGRYEAIAASWDIDDVTASSESITEAASQCQDMNCNIGRHHARVLPDLRRELLFAHQLAGAFEQGDEHIEDAAAEVNRCSGLGKETLHRGQPEGPKYDRRGRWVDRRIRRRCHCLSLYVPVDELRGKFMN